MRVITTIPEMRAFSRHVRAGGSSLGLVPTMGALHEGHFSLIRQARRQSDAVAVSIFVNPTQFDSPHDLARYPQNLERDLDQLRPFKVDVVFAPTPAEMYPPGFQTFVEPGDVAARFEGASRPGHFRGVATIVLKLFNIIEPALAYFGQKDFQQVLAVRRLVEDLNLPIRLVVCPIVREADGLAVSSRNERLNAAERQAAAAIHRSLRQAERLAHEGETEARRLLEEMKKVLASEPLVQPDYAAIVEPRELQPVERVVPGSVVLVAARVGDTRLIDNLILGPPGSTPETLIQLALGAGIVADAQARVPGLEAESLRLKIEACRDCAALTAIQLPPREFLAKYVKTFYPDLNAVRVAVIGRDSPLNPDNFLYRNPRGSNRFFERLFELVGVKDFEEFRSRFALTDAIRCHSGAPRVPEKALGYCSRHLREDLKLFPNLTTLVVLGEDACLQFQQFILERAPERVRRLEGLAGEKGWAEEEVRIPSLGERALRVLYCYHPTFGYRRSPSLAPLLGGESGRLNL
jgi:pantoate--beta-alanine ligase